MPTNAGKSGSTVSGELSGGRLAGVSRSLGPTFESRISFMLVTMLVAAVGLSRMFLRRLLIGRVFALAVSWPQLPPAPTALSASAYALPELDLLREARSAAAHTTGEHVGALESSGTFSYSKMKPDCVEDETSQMNFPGEKSHAVR